jgi:hypothetical protein
MRPSIEVSIELTAQELLAPPSTGLVEVEDVCAVDPGLEAGCAAPNTAPARPAGAASQNDSVEIELTAEQIDALLSGRP